MYLLLGITLLGAVLGVPLHEQDVVSQNDALEVAYALPGESVPTFYDVQLFLDPGNEANFTGIVEIRVLATIQTNVLVLHAMEMDIDSVEVYRDGDDTDIFDSFVLDRSYVEKLTINLNTTISPAVPHIVRIAYRANFADNMLGVYISRYEDNGQTVNLITSQLQPTYARRTFPCYDEPGLKAIFRTTIYAPAAYDVIRTNMPERNDTLKADVAGWVKHEFEDTLVMSTYLLGYLVSNFEHIDNVANPIYHIPFKVFSRPGTKDHSEFALQYGQENMNALEEYTEFAYAFPKLDKVAVPDFGAGAMENWGIVIYREIALLVQDGVTTTAITQNIARLICHENVHMWFGNEVSPVTWTYTWLNEGFANLFESYGTDLVSPGYRMMDQFVLLVHNVMQSDAVLSVNPMTHPVFTPSQILSTFNAVAYQKSGSVLRMMQHAMTPEVFRKGLVIYIKEHARDAVRPSALFAGLQQALDESNQTFPDSITNVLEPWTLQGGFPVVTVTRSAPTANSLVFDQERYLTDRSLSSNYRWHIPVNWVLSTDPDFSDTSPQGWVSPSTTAESIEVEGLSEAEWFIVNKQETGYYRVNYAEENWKALAQVLMDSHETIHLLNRAQIIDDSFNLARNERLSYEQAFEISRYLETEKDYIPWGAANVALEYLDVVLGQSPEVYSLFQGYMLKITAPLFAELGFQAAANEEWVTAYHRNLILNINCRYGNEECETQAQELLDQFRSNPNQPLNPDIQTTVFCAGLRRGDEESFDFLWERFAATQDSSQHSILLNALGCTSNADRLEFYLNQVIDDSSPVRDQDKHTVIVSTINSSPENMEIALEFVIEHFHEIQPRVQQLTGTTNILNAFSRRLTSDEHRTKIDELFSRHESILSAGEAASIAGIRENIAASITWRGNNLASVDSWLQENFGNGAFAAAPALFVIIAALLSVLMQ